MKPRVIELPEHYRGPGYEANGPFYCVTGTAYGYIHRTDGCVRTWKSRSGAYKAMKKYLELWG